MIPVDRLRWKIDGQDVTCVNCHTAIYRPSKGESPCQTCASAFATDIANVHNSLATKARTTA